MPSFAAYFCLLVLSLFVSFGQALPIPQQNLTTRNVTIGFNSSQVVFSPDSWEVVSAIQGSDPSFTSSNVIGASFGVSLPNGTVGVDYIGVPRSAGAAYVVCIDCDLVDSTKGKWSIVDGNQPDLTNENQAAPIVLFSVVSLDPNVHHSLTVTNIPDTRFDNTSEITFESLNVKVANVTGSSTSGTATSSTISHSAASSSTSDSSASETSGAESEPTPPPDAHVKVTPTSATPSPTANSTNNDSAESTSGTQTQKFSNTVIAVVVVVCVVVLFCLAAGLILVYRMRRKRAEAIFHDAESRAYDNSQWATPNHLAPFTGMQEVPLSSTPVRPRNPFEDQFPPDVPLELETPGDSTLMSKREMRRPRSSFGNGLYDYYEGERR